MAHLKTYSLQAKHNVFLSHSDAQTEFVGQLCVDLESRGLCPFFNRSHWPIGQNFPRLTFEAIEQCEVGVVVLSEEFFRSKRPMLELVAMAHVKKGKPNFKILPIFLGISVSQIFDVDNQKRWLSMWHRLEECDRRIDVEDWAIALRLLRLMNGLSYNFELGEVKLQEEIVKAICMLVPRITWFEDSHIQGRSRLCKVIHERIQQSKLSSLYGVHVVGLYGVVGTGKTTLCKAMCNDVSEEFHDKVAHIELGSQSQEGLLKKVLKRLGGKNLKYLDAMNVDEYRYRLMMRDLMNVKVFLTIDNVSHATSKHALTLLRAHYGPGSVVLVTARSLNELMSLRIDASDCMEMPELELEEAKSLFLYHVACVLPSYSSDEDDHELILSCVQRCYFKKGDGIGCAYHPLALQTLGNELGCVGYDPKQWWSLLYEIDFLNPFEEPFVFAMWRRSFGATIPEDQISISDGYPVSEDSFPNQLEDKTIEPEVEMLGMLSPYFMGMLPPYSSINGALKFTMAELNIITGNFSENLKVGQRGSGSVYRGQLKDGTTVAVKRIMKNDKNVLEIGAGKDFEIEADTLSKEKHLNLVRLLGFLENENELILVTEYVTNGNLRQHLDGVPYGVILDMSKRCRISLDVVAALRHLHNQTKEDLDIIHRDIKSLDILITDGFRAKVAGFGLSRHSPIGDVPLKQFHSSSSIQAVMAHEYSTTHHLKEQNDVYSFGELLVEIFTGKCVVESNLPNDECFTLKWVLKQCAKGRLMDIIDPKISPTTFDLKILKQIFKLAASCLVLEESRRPTVEGVFGVFSFIVGLYSGDLEDQSNSKEDEYEVQKDEEDSSNPSFMPTKSHGGLFIEGSKSSKVQTSTQLGTQLEVDSKQAKRQALELLVAKQDQSSPLFTNIISDVLSLKSNETYFEMLQEKIAKLGYISRLLSQGDDFEPNLTNIGQTSFFLYFNEEDNVFEFYFKDFQSMASIVGVGLECGKVVLEDGWRMMVHEIPKPKWDDAWKNFDSSSSAMKVTISDPLEEIMDNMEDSQASIPKGHCLLLDLAQYFILEKAIASFLSKASMTHANTNSGTSSSPSNQNIASSSSSDPRYSSLVQGMENLFLAGKAFTQLMTKNGDGPPMNPLGDGKIDTTVHLKLLSGGCLFDGSNVLDATIFDDEELKELTSQLDKTIYLEMTFKFLNEVDRKEIHVTVGPISFQLQKKIEVNHKNTRRHGWYHESMDVSFGPVNAGDSEVGPNHKALETSKRKGSITKGSTDATTCGTSKSMHGEVSGTIAHSITISGGGSSGSSTTTCVTDNAGIIDEEEFELTRGGFVVSFERDLISSTLEYSYRAPKYIHGFDHGKLPHEDYRKYVPKHLPTCTSQDVIFEGTWLPGDSENNPQAVAEYSLHTSREVHMTSKDIPEKVAKRSFITMICGHPKIPKESNEPLKYTQKYVRSIFLNHAMTHLNGEQFKVREVLNQRPLNRRESETHLEVHRPHALQWGTNPLLGLDSELDSQP